MVTASLSDPITDWVELLKKQSVFEENGQEWIFRGQSNGSWPLASTLERAVEDFDLDRKLIPDFELKLLHEFMRHYHLYAPESPPRAGDTLDWLALMRHHGTPTRILDFTFSFPVAAYFALEEKGKNPVVHAVNKSWLTNLIRQWATDRGKFEILERLGKYREGRAFRELFMFQIAKFVCPVSPFRLNQRITVQKGIFLCPGDVTYSFEENIKTLPGCEENVIVVPIASECRNEMLRKLDQMALNRASLFPGLDGFAQSLRTRLLQFAELQKLEAAGARTPDNIGIDILNLW